MTNEEKLELMIQYSAQFLDNLEMVATNAGLEGEERSDFFLNILSLTRCLFVQASHEQMGLKNQFKWDTLRVIQGIDKKHMGDLIRNSKKEEYKH